MMPLSTRRSSTRATPRGFVGQERRDIRPLPVDQIMPPGHEASFLCPAEARSAPTLDIDLDFQSELEKPAACCKRGSGAEGGGQI